MARARRQPRKGVEDRLCLRHRQVFEGQQQIPEGRGAHHLARHRRLHHSCLEQLLHADELREPDEKGHHEQVRARGDDGLSEVPPRNLFHRKPRRRAQDRRAGAHQQKKPRERGKAAPEHQEKALRQHRHLKPRRKVCRLPHARRLAPRDLHRRGRQRPRQRQALARRRVSGHHARARQDLKLSQGRLSAHFQE